MEDDDDARALVAEERIDVLLSDIEMPRTEDRLRALRAGFQMHLPKLVQPAELITVVASLATRRD